MDDDLDQVVTNIRALIQSSKGEMLVRNILRDYETMIGSKIPFRKYNFTTLEDFLRSLPTLRVFGTGDRALVEAAASNASKHVTELISKQKSSKPSSQPRKQFIHSYRGRGGRGRGGGGYQPRPPRDYYSRDQPPRDYNNAREYSRDEPSWDYNDARDYSRDEPLRDHKRGFPPEDNHPSKDYSHASSAPKRYSPPNTQNRHEATGAYSRGPLTIKVDGEDKRQVTFKRKTELPPRFQKQKQNVATPPTPPISPGAQGFDSSLFLDQSNTATKSGAIISPLGPSQLIAAGRAKQQAEKAMLEEQMPSDLLLPSGQRTSDLAARFARLSHENSFNGHNQMVKEPSALPLPQSEDVPQPDEFYLPNNIGALLRYCSSHNWPEPTFHRIPSKCPDTQKNKFLASVRVFGDGNNTFKVSSFPYLHENEDFAKGYAAKEALKKLLAEESKVTPNKAVSSDPKIICNRISDIVTGALNGMFTGSVEDEYIKRHNELLPKDWLEMLNGWPTLAVESTIHSSIIVPVNPALAVRYDSTVTPPPLPIEALGNNEEGTEDVYITHATSVSNVWFKVIGEGYSDEYNILLSKMDAYYTKVGEKELALTLEVNHYYAARHFDLEQWFRVCVLEVYEDSNTVLAWLVDHGDNEVFPFSSLYRLAPQFCQLPRQAAQCVLEGLESFSDDDAANEFVRNSELLIGRSLVAKITHKDVESGFVKAFLYDTSGDDDVEVNEMIIDQIITKAWPALPAEGSAKEAAIGDVSNKGEVYIMFPGPSLERIVDILDSLGPDKISEHKLTSFKRISMNKMYLAKYSQDDNWYRAVVIATPSITQNKIPVRFVDFGNTESVSITDIADLENLPPILRKLPPQAMKVALHNLPIETLSNSEVARLHSLLLDEDKVVLIKTVSLKADPPILEIFTKEVENTGLASVNDTILLQRELYRNEDRQNPFSIASFDANINQFTDNQDNFVLKCPDLDNSAILGVLVVLAAHPGNFIFQSKKYAKDIQKLRKQMNAYYDAGSLPELPKSRVLKNKLFAARYVDDMWYRVVVTDSPMGSRVPVRLCDFGDVTFVPVSSLRELAPEFLEYPFMAIKGRLAGVVPVHKDWSVEDCIRFRNLVVDKILAETIVDIQKNNENPMEMVVTLHLVDTSTDDDLNIADILVHEKRAVREG